MTKDVPHKVLGMTYLASLSSQTSYLCLSWTLVMMSQRNNVGAFTGAGADAGFWKGGVQPWRTSPKVLLGECERGLTPPLTGESGGLPRIFFLIGCFLLQSRHSSALIPGLLTQDFSHWHGLTNYSDKKAAYLQLGRCRWLS